VCDIGFLWQLVLNDAMEYEITTNGEFYLATPCEEYKENNTFTLTTLPQGRKLVGGRWVYTVKENPNGPKTYKARYVAKG